MPDHADDDEAREQFTTCERCSKPIYVSDQYQPAGECDFCPDHAATIGDILQFWEADIASTDYPAWRDEFDSVEDAREWLVALRAWAERDGADCKPLCRAGEQPWMTA